MQALIDAGTVFSPVTGTVRSVRDESQSNPFGYGDGSRSGSPTRRATPISPSSPAPITV